MRQTLTFGLAATLLALPALATPETPRSPHGLAPAAIVAEPAAIEAKAESAAPDEGYALRPAPGAVTPGALAPSELAPITPALTGFAARILEALERAAPLHVSNAGEPAAAAVRAYYERTGFRPIWTDGQRPLERARSLMAAVLASVEDGLEPADYLTPGVQTLFTATDEASLARLEAALTWALVRLTSDLASGRTVPQEVDSELFVHPHDIDPRTVLTEAASLDDVYGFVARHAPQTDAYRKLKATLQHYRSIRHLGGWKVVSAGPTLRIGDRSPRVTELKQALNERGEAMLLTEGDVYDQEVAAAVRLFQIRHGLVPDGRFGANTRTGLNTTADRRIQQVKINMERRRWMPDDLGQRYAFVNMADYRLRIVFDGETVYETRVVVGTAADRTPVFSDRMTYLVINPYWNIPPSIARDEMLPQLREDPYALAAKGIRVFSSWAASAEEVDPWTVDWTQVSRRGFPYKLRQDPGDQNALGRVKFMFPNQFNIYLHDTPSKSLFRRTVRAFSHGCIRVEDPFRLAKLLLEGDARWTPERFDAQLASLERRVVTLPKPINVHLTYLTAWVDDDGKTQFRNDIYGRDRRLARALAASREVWATAAAEDPAATAAR